jgi:hypothetical protein
MSEIPVCAANRLKSLFTACPRKGVLLVFHDFIREFVWKKTIYTKRTDGGLNGGCQKIIDQGSLLEKSAVKSVRIFSKVDQSLCSHTRFGKSRRIYL